MKQLLICLILSLMAAGLAAQDYGLYWKFKDYDGAIAVTAPRWVVHAGSWFLDEKADRKLLRKVRKVRVLVFEDTPNPVSALDLQRFFAKAKKRNLEELLTVRDGSTRVSVLAKERKNTIRKLVVLVREPETFALVSVRCKISFDEIGTLLDRIPKEKKNENSPEVPLLPTSVRNVIRL
jgi:hypothetical protein